jgi:hypothetical protein
MSQDIHVHIHLASDELVARVALLEEQIMSVETDLNALTAAVDEWREDIAARVAALEAAQGEFTVEGQAAFDALKASVDAGVATTGDADADGNPAPPPPPPTP